MKISLIIIVIIDNYHNIDYISHFYYNLFNNTISFLYLSIMWLKKLPSVYMKILNDW